MSRTPARFTQADIARAVKGAQAAGLPIASVEVDSTGKIVILTAKRHEPPPMDAGALIARRLARMSNG